mmetsp:Transcript_2197/g.7894  ORF Transcript_2197/g.7894 Transcript_2197/m.7894 type:complete len:155 (-) Transcript_2197:95-559(-)|eukprot:CAMPEP_0114612142 /NCGR_PEP_ID=MMETSP0168-20121206/4472_1 /TAXON_ID=95228 ORGANISM="Vannella sp., Strain DIVA3 517/6/12" /NCGR_SAMPLE_ID=MMETSP0168 /ASSEMBLY_ACC=CAM_ASM_000044 /LENGTH=154 /DNA_ID=CAMNT_0001823123 /DNA_START=76 /DNA_END=540 /DNA_ORIENTATION=+
MKSTVFAVCLLLAVCVGFAACATRIDARGWNDEIAWYNYEDGLELAKETGKPMMIVLHKTWCGACKRLKPQFAESAEIQELSEKFVMVNAEDDEAPHADTRYQADGGYIPRIYFANANGDAMEQQNNARVASGQYLYFYATPSEVIASMKAVAN